MWMPDRFKPLNDDDPKIVGGYELRARLGAGGMGRVYLAFTPGGRALAVKVVRPDYAEDDEFRRRFRKEIEAAQLVQGLYTAPVVDADSDARLPWMATAYVPGPSLHQAVTQCGPLPLPSVFRLLAGVAEGLTAIHSCELIHRDLKPANVLLAEDGPRVIDFGIAHAADATTMTSTHVRIGTPAFMAPEQIRGRSASPATDVFALGNLAVFAATGRTAFGEGNPDAMFFRIINEDPDLDSCDPKLRVIVERCLAKEPGQRPPVAEIMDYARRQTEGQTVNLAGAWLPEPVATSLKEYGTVKYAKAAKNTRVETTAEGAKVAKNTRRETTAEGAKGSGTPAVFGLLAVLAFFAVLVIGPGKVMAWVMSDGTPSGSPEYTPSSSPKYTLPSSSDTGLDTKVSEEKTADPGCERASQAISSNRDTFDKASSASMSSLASNLDAAGDAADDPQVASTIRDLANASRSMSDSNRRLRSGSRAEEDFDAFDAGFEQWKAAADTLKSLCEW